MDSNIGVPASVRIVNVTPALAAEWLANNKGNRPVNSRRVSKFAKAMAAKEWKRNGEPIIFDSTGTLRDGQHRLCAVISANATVEMYVVFDEPEADILTIDQGSARTPGQGFSCLGQSNANKKAATASLLAEWKKTTTFRRAGGVHESSVVLVDVWTSFKVPEEFTKWSDTLRFFRTNVPPSAVLATAIIMRQDAGEEQAVKFMGALDSGEALRRTHPLYQLRRNIENRGLMSRVAHHSWAAQVFAAWCVRAWGMMIRGEDSKCWKMMASDYDTIIRFQAQEFAEYE